MTLIDQIHRNMIFKRRTRVLSERLAELIPPHSRLLDVGCGNGLVAARLMKRRPDIAVTGLDVLPRKRAHIPVTIYDGSTLPHNTSSVDWVLFVDVLHHADNPPALMAEGCRVARRGVIIKDHILEGPGAQATLRLMDLVGNLRYGVSLPYRYWNREQWQRQIAVLGMTIDHWNERVGLYPWPLSLLFERRLHFIALLTA